MQATKRPSRDDLSSPLVGSRQDDQQLALRGMTDAVEAAQLVTKCGSKVGKRLGRKTLAVGVRKLLDIVEAHKQATQRGAMAPGAVDLLIQAPHHLRAGKAVVWLPRRALRLWGVSGNHADW